MIQTLTSTMILSALFLLAACTPGPEPIHYGEDACDHCRMTIADERYGAELVTGTGKIYKFDSIECLAGFLQEDGVAEDEVHSLWVTDFSSPTGLVPADEAFYLHSTNLRSPMGMNLTAFGGGITREAVRDSFGGEVLSWQDVRQKVRAARGHPVGAVQETGH